MRKEDFIYGNWPFLLIAFIYILAGLTASKYFGDHDLHLLLNGYNNGFFDTFFRYFTKTGEWFAGTLVLLWLFFKRSWRTVLFFVTAAVIQTVLVQFMKKTLFIDHWRPGFYFEQRGVDLHWVEGVERTITFAFPSGHTATAFFVLLILSCLTKNRLWQSIFGLLAVLAAYSRIYLSQHFMLDTVAGALIGIFAVIVSYYIWTGLKLSFLDRKVIEKSSE